MPLHFQAERGTWKIKLQKYYLCLTQLLLLLSTHHGMFHRHWWHYWSLRNITNHGRLGSCSTEPWVSIYGRTIVDEQTPRQKQSVFKYSMDYSALTLPTSARFCASTIVSFIILWSCVSSSILHDTTFIMSLLHSLFIIHHHSIKTSYYISESLQVPSASSL